MLLATLAPLAQAGYLPLLGLVALLDFRLRRNHIATMRMRFDVCRVEGDGILHLNDPRG